MMLVSQSALTPERYVLDNGTVLLAKENRTIPAVAINATFRAGTVYEPPGLPGLAFFVSRVLDRGTETRRAEDIADELDSRGVTLTLAVTRHATTISCTVLEEDFEFVLTMLGDIALSAVFPEPEIEIRRGEIITLIHQDEDNPAVMAVEGVLALIYSQDHPYGIRLKGNVESVTRMTRSDLVAFHADRFRPSSLTLAIVGAVKPTHALAAAERAFSRRGSGVSEPTLPQVPMPTARRQVVIPMMNKTQADVAYGFAGPRRLDPDYYAHWVMNNILGQHGLGGRLGDKIREQQGMAYYAFSSLEANVEKGPLVIRAGVNAANVDRTIDIIDQEVERFAREGPTSTELVETKQYLIGSIPRMLETNTGIANFLQIVEFFRLGLEYDVRLPSLIDAVTLEETHEVARRLLDPSRAAVVIAGPYAGARA